MTIADKSEAVLEEYKAIVEEMVREDADAERFTWAEAARGEVKFAELETLGQTLVNDDQRERFRAVKENLIREVLSELSTLKQAYQYLENFEMRLLHEAETAK